MGTLLHAASFASPATSVKRFLQRFRAYPELYVRRRPAMASRVNL